MSNQNYYLEEAAQREDVNRQDWDLAFMSAAVSLKRIADNLGLIATAMNQCDNYGDTGAAAIRNAIREGMRP